MNKVVWKIKNITNGEILDICESIFTVGRNPSANLTSTNNALSRNHATLSILIDGCLYVQDCKSCNGTFVNNQKIPVMEMKLLNQGDIVGFGICQDMTDKVQDVPLIYEVLKIDDDSKIKSEDKQQEEEQDQTVKLPIPEFSKDSVDDCIVISDGEDDDTLINSSQILKFSEIVKVEQEEQPYFNESIDPYLHIKQELSDLDFCDNNQHVASVDLTDEREHFETTTELMDILESPSPHTAIAEEHESSSKYPKSKYIKPPIVEPHIPIMPTGKKRNKSGSNGNEQKLTKNKDKSPRLPSKRAKTGNNLVESRSDKKYIAEEFKKRNKTKTLTVVKQKIDKDNKQMIKSERKRKLKEISEKAKHSSGVTKTGKSPSKIKISKSRGNFLLEDNVTTTTTNYVKLDNTAPSTSGYNKQNACQRKTVQENQIQDTTVSSNYSPDTYRSTTHTSTTLALYNKEANFKRVDPRCEEGNSRFISTTTSNTRSIMNNNINMINTDEQISMIVHWTVRWLREQKGFDVSPPVNGEQQLKHASLLYNSCDDYFSTVTPLIVLELWQYVYETYYDKNEERAPLRAYLHHKRNVGDLTYLDCECYVGIEDVQQNNVIRADDFALIEVKVKDARNYYIHSLFGYIKSFRRFVMRDEMIINKEIAELCPTIPHTDVSFTLVTRHLLDKEIVGKHIIIRVIGNIASYLRLIKTIKCIPGSPICTQILNPNIEDYQISAEQDDLFIEVNLNSFQKKIVLEASSLCLRDSPGLYLVKGPPGTGKSTVIINIVLQILFSGINTNKKPPLILLTAPSNAAVDNLVLKLAEIRSKLSDQRRILKLIRIGPDSSISKSVDKFKLTSLAANHVLRESGLNMSEEFKKALHVGTDTQNFLKKSLGPRYFYEIKSAEDTLLLGSNVICTTLNSCVTPRILDCCRRNQLQFSCCIVDEATQCSEPECLFPIQLGIDKFVLVGDPKQLPAVVCNKEAQRLGYGKSLFARIDDNFKRCRESPIKMLHEQYRMKEEICNYPNKTFYGGLLKSFPIHTNRIVPGIKPYLLFNLMVSENQDNSHYQNSEEAQFIYSLLHTLHNIVKSECKYSIGVITPYKAQKELVMRRISDIRFNPNVSITVNTIDGFQGMENDIIIISCVRYSPNNFLQNEQRLNVALTRAKQALYIIGNYSLFKHCRLLYDLREDAKKRKLCYDINENSRNIINLHKYIIQR